MASLIRVLDGNAERYASRPACIVGTESLSYAELRDASCRFASSLLDLGLQPGDRVSLYLPNSVSYIICYLGAMRAGLIANPINSVFTPHEVEYLLTDSAAAAVISTPELLGGLADVLPRTAVRAVICAGDAAGQPGADGWHAVAEMLAAEPAPLPYPDDQATACLPYSSGTTGRSKGILHSHHSLAMQALLSANHLQMRPGDVLAQALPLVHLYPGNIIMGGLLVAGATMAVQPVFDPPGFASLLAGLQATSCAGVPTTYAMLCQLDEKFVASLDLSALQIAFSAGAPLPSRVRSEFQRLFGCRILDCYGITEAAGNLTATLRFGDSPELSCGVPYPFTEVRIVDAHDAEVPDGAVGELIARGPQIMSGYWNRPADTEITLRGGWLHTGDLARRDASGFFYIVDRAKDVIITGGYNVYPAEVEEVLQSHPDVALCASFGVPDQVKGEKPWAAIVPRAGAQLDEAALEKYCRQYLAPYKVPRRFLLVDALPRSPVGKILRRELRAQFGAGAEAAQAPLPSATAGSP
ncbi:MAG TPA: long-chain-fatty-acid--CoA ligase [Actinobacteria bacterium]|nr:long-chain-fatty-acid--CoA ligase [Actinomycetota bacterium]